MRAPGARASYAYMLWLCAGHCNVQNLPYKLECQHNSSSVLGVSAEHPGVCLAVLAALWPLPLANNSMHCADHAAYLYCCSISHSGVLARCQKGKSRGAGTLPLCALATSWKSAPWCAAIANLRVFSPRCSSPQAEPPPLALDPPPPPPPSPEWHLLWADEFDRTDPLGPGSCWEAQLGDGTDYHCPGWGNNER